MEFNRRRESGVDLSSGQVLGGAEMVLPRLSCDDLL